MSEYNQTLGNKISTLRKEHSMTQDQLATALSVTFQAVSKWENGLSCPDISLIPKIADLFSITLDELFGREVPAPIPAPTASPLPWEDDGKLRAALFIGHKYVKDEMTAEKSRVTFEYDGPALAIESAFSIRCGDVQGPISAGGNVECKNVTGSVSAGGNIALDHTDGNVSAGGKVIYTAGDDVRIEIENALSSAKSSIKSGLSNLGSALSGIFTRDEAEKIRDESKKIRMEAKKLRADNLHIRIDTADDEPAGSPISTLPWEDDGNLRAVLFHGQKLVDRAELTGSRSVTLSFSGRVNNIDSAFDVECSEVHGSVTAGGDINCGNVSGSATASGDMDCGSVGGNATSAGDMDCGSVGGNASAGGDMDCGDVGRDVTAGGDVSSGDVSGSVRAGGDVNAGDVGGDVASDGDVNCGDVSGNVSAGGDLSCGDIGGGVR